VTAEGDPSPTVTVAIPVLNEEACIERCLDAVDRQTYPGIVEVLVVDGGSTDATVRLARRHPRVRIVVNPQRIQACALNLALAQSTGALFVRVDGHCEIADDYVSQCVAALARTGASMVGGRMVPVVAGGMLQQGIAAAMSSRLGAGPARFHSGGAAGPVDTVYLGAFWTAVARDVGGYAEDQPVNEDAELAQRMMAKGPVWFEPAIRSTYVPRSDLLSLGRQFWRYGRGRAATVRKHPASLAPRQLIAPLLVLGLLSGWRRRVLVAYAAFIGGAAAVKARSDPKLGLGFAVALPTMHLLWGTGFLVGLSPHGAGSRRAAALADSTDR